MKDKLMYLVGKMAVKAYEKTVVKPARNELKHFRVIKEMNEVAHTLLEDDDPRYNDLGARIAKANLKALANMAKAN